MARVAFRQADVERNLRAIRAVHGPDVPVEIRPNGAVFVLTAAKYTTEGEASDLDVELEAWRAKHGNG